MSLSTGPRIRERSIFGALHKGHRTALVIDADCIQVGREGMCDIRQNLIPANDRSIATDGSCPIESLWPIPRATKGITHLMNKTRTAALPLAFAGLMLLSGTALCADDGGGFGNGNGNGNACQGLPSYSSLQAQLSLAQAQSNGGFGLNMWATVVNRDGVVCAVAFTGNTRGDQWPGSRVISAQKANTANAFSLPGLALSTANLYSAVQPGGTLYGLQASNPVSTDVAYGGNSSNYGQPNDPWWAGRSVL